MYLKTTGGGAILLDKEIVEMVVILILMSGAHFKEAVDYITKTEMQPGERDFMELAVKIAGEKRRMVQTPAKPQIQ